MGGGDCLMEAMRILVMEFLAKVRAEVDWVIFFRLGLKIKGHKEEDGPGFLSVGPKAQASSQA
jgi:hypothetical protein